MKKLLYLCLGFILFTGCAELSNTTTKKVEEFNCENFGNTPIIYAGAINGTASTRTDQYIKEREKKGRVADKLAELCLKPSLCQILKQKNMHVMYTKVCHKDCKEFKSCLQKV
jgi:uncharacterized lipoprotein YajG